MITVIMTVYNRQEYYKSALDSLAKQTDKSFELLVYSNILLDYDFSQFKDPRVIENAPIPVNLKYADGLRKAKYDKIAFLDDDDVFAPNKVEFLNDHAFTYLHNEYFHISPGQHNYGRGFNMSSIAINKKWYSGLADAFQKNDFTGKSPDSFVFWYTLEHKIPYKIIKEELTGYRFRDYTTLQKNMVNATKIQMETNEEMKHYFSSKEVLDIINDRIISSKIMLQSYGVNEYVSLYDIVFILKYSDRKFQKLISYLLTTKYLKFIGFRIINLKRNKKYSNENLEFPLKKEEV